MRLIDADALNVYTIVRLVATGEQCENVIYAEDIDNAPTVDAADALEAVERILDQNIERCEALRKQLREAHEGYEQHLAELEAQLQTVHAVQVVRCNECKHTPRFDSNDFWCDKWEREFGSDWFCADGERKDG